jgi:U2 small nuclear ribonucleoprotein A'
MAGGQDYRLFVISRCPMLKMLDFKKVTAAERTASIDGNWGQRSAAEFDRKMSSSRDASKGVKRKKGEEGDFEPQQEVQTTKKQPSKDELMAIKAAIANAATLDEVERLEKALMEADNGGVAGMDLT